MTKVDITTAGHTVIVESDEDLDTVAAKALQLWQDTRDPRLDRVHGATGFVAERSEPTYTSGFDADLGHAHAE